MDDARQHSLRDEALVPKHDMLDVGMVRWV